MPEKATPGPDTGLVHVALAGAEGNSKEGYDISGILLNDGLDLAVQLLARLDIDSGIGLVQEDIEFFVAIVR